MESRFFLYISLAVDLTIAVSKFIAAAFTGSPSMVSEGVHSVIDATSQLLLIWGVKTSKRHPDSDRPFGYGKELYFWSFIVSLVIFLLGGCISLYEGLTRLKQPAFAGSPDWNYAILAGAFVFNLISMTSALKAFNAQRGKITFWKAVVITKDPSTIIVLLGDFGDLLGLVVAFLGIYIGRMLHNPYYDGLASMLIGLILITISGFLVRESKSLLMGETTSLKTRRRILAIAQADQSVVKVKKHLSMYMAPEEILLQLDTVFEEGLTTHQMIEGIARIKKAIRAEFPRIKSIVIDPVAK